MKASQSAVRELSGAIQEFGTRQEDADGAEVYYTDDASVVFGKDASGQRVFQGLSFEMAARDFHVLPNLELVISESPVNSSENDVYTIEDAAFADYTSRYLTWRAEFLRELKI